MPRKSLELHKAEGTLRSRVVKGRASEMKLTPAPIGECPDWMSEEGRAEWDMITSHEQYSKVLCPLHRGVLIEYCSIHGRMIRAESGCDKITATDRQLLNSLRMQLGLTPASQSKVKVPVQEPNADNPWHAIASKKAAG